MKTPQKPFPELSHTLNIPQIWLKREDLHPYGSHKGRSIPLMIKEYVKQGIKNFVISSSGNAALAAMIAIQKHNQNNPHSGATLTICLGTHINESKLKHLYKTLEDTEHIKIEKGENPKQMAFQMEKSGTAKNLRQSTDELALKGYIELAEDLSKIENLQAVFIPTSSGTTAQALGEAFVKMNLPIQIHIVQTTACHPMSEAFDTNAKEGSSLAGAIVDKVAHRKQGVLEVIHKTQGSGWIIDNEEINDAIDLVKKTCDIEISPNSALSVAGLKKAIAQGWNWTGAVACLITGR